MIAENEEEIMPPSLAIQKMQGRIVPHPDLFFLHI